MQNKSALLGVAFLWIERVERRNSQTCTDVFGHLLFPGAHYVLGVDFIIALREVRGNTLVVKLLDKLERAGCLAVVVELFQSHLVVAEIGDAVFVIQLHSAVGVFGDVGFHISVGTYCVAACVVFLLSAHNAEYVEDVHCDVAFVGCSGVERELECTVVVGSRLCVAGFSPSAEDLVLDGRLAEGDTVQVGVVIIVVVFVARDEGESGEHRDCNAPNCVSFHIVEKLNLCVFH